MDQVVVDLKVSKGKLKEMMEFYKDIFKDEFKILKDKTEEKDINKDEITFRIGKTLVYAHEVLEEVMYSPAVSFFVSSDNEDLVSNYFNSLSKEGNILMELGEYPFSKKYGWLNDKYGISWQFSMDEDMESKHINMNLFIMLYDENYGRGKELINEYIEKVGGKTLRIIEDDKSNLHQGVFSMGVTKVIVFDSEITHQFKVTDGIGFRVINPELNKDESKSFEENEDRFNIRWRIQKN